MTETESRYEVRDIRGRLLGSVATESHAERIVEHARNNAHRGVRITRVAHAR